MKMTQKQKNNFTRAIIERCSGKQCPSDLGLEDIDDGKCAYRRASCEECARRACEKFFDEVGI
jgi:hypothetical protein